MRIALLDFHRVKNKKIEETIKISEVLKESGADEVEIFEMLRNIPPDIDTKRYDGLVISGSDSTYIEKYRGYKRAIEIVNSLCGSSVPILGICAGNQLLAGLYKLDISYLESPEMGWYEIELTDKGKEDPLFFEMQGKFVSFECHIKNIVFNDGINLPVLAKNQNCIQAIKYDDYIWGIQFHPEDSLEEGNSLINKYTRRPPSSLSQISNPERLIGRRIFKNFISIAGNI